MPSLAPGACDTIFYNSHILGKVLNAAGICGTVPQQLYNKGSIYLP